jgi:hypothetical protein
MSTHVWYGDGIAGKCIDIDTASEEELRAALATARRYLEAWSDVEGPLAYVKPESSTKHGNPVRPLRLPCPAVQAWQPLTADPYDRLSVRRRRHLHWVDRAYLTSEPEIARVVGPSIKARPKERWGLDKDGRCGAMLHESVATKSAARMRGLRDDAPVLDYASERRGAHKPRNFLHGG